MQAANDPYYHPHLSPHKCDPALRAVLELSPVESVRIHIEHADPPADQLMCLDWFDEQSLGKQLVSLEVSLPALVYSPAKVPESTAEAARCILSILHRHAEIRRQFPFALSEGVQGAFCDWLCTEGLRRFRLPAQAADTIRAAFVENPGMAIRQVLTFRDDLRHLFPNALLPTGHKKFLHWLLKRGTTEYEFQEEQIWWLFLESMEDPARELAYTYRISKEWQRNFPSGLTPFGRDKFLNWVSQRFRLADEVLQTVRARTSVVTLDDLQMVYWTKPEWREKYPRAFRDPQSTGELAAWVAAQESFAGNRIDLGAGSDAAASDRPAGMNILGHFCYPSGLQHSVKSIAQSLEMMGVPVSLRDVPVSQPTDDSDRTPYLGFESHDVTLIHVQPEPHFPVCYERAGLIPRSDVYRIGMWYWELETIPPYWKQVGEPLQELWAPTKFIAKALENVMPQKITRMLPGLELGPVAAFDRRELGLSPDQYVFLFMFDMKSIMERKNPLGLIAAYEKAFRKDDRVKLVIKVSSGQANPPEALRLKEAAKKAGALVVDEVFSRARAYGLIDASDCYVSLHRSEGLGLTMAEAMLLAKPVVATRYSGNLDFMDPSHSLLVDYQLQQIGGHSPDYVLGVYQADAFWADPSIEHAAHAMRWAYEHPEDAKAMGRLAKAHALSVLSPKACALRLKTRLDEITNDLKSSTAIKKAA